MTKKRPTQSWLINRPQSEAAYLKALRFFWQGERESALALLSDELSEGAAKSPENLYRLWIEVLADSQAEASLRELIAHLERSINFGLISVVNGTALLALCRYELGEREAALMHWRSVQKHGNAAYARELTLILSEDDDVKDQAAHTLCRVSNDYFHLRRASLHFHATKQSQAYKSAVQVLDEVFPGNPLAQEVLFHSRFARKQYKAALRSAEMLRAEFPQQCEYQFLFAYTSYMTRGTKIAREEFESLNRRLEGTDPDVLHMLGLSTFAEAGGQPEQIAKARHYLNRSKERYMTMGYPSLQLEESLMNLASPKLPAESKCWVVKLTAKQAWDLSQRSEDGIRNLHKAMGEFVEKGDYCFFVTESRLADDEHTGLWRLHAVYRATSAPEWHPTHRWKTALSLVVRMEAAVPIEVEGNAFASRHAAAMYGLLEIEKDALHHIQECIEEYTLEDSRYVKIFETLRIAG